MKILLAGIILVALPHGAAATTKGLNQIVTPDIQNAGQLSLSFQVEDRVIGNPYQLQAELGMTKWLEAAVFQGLSPNEQIFAMLVGLVQQEPYLLTTGFVNWSTTGEKPEPVLEGGYYTEHDKLLAGAIAVDDRVQSILGWAHDFDPTWRAQIDFQSGRNNFSTLGFTCTPSQHFQFNPAMYVANRSPHHVYGYLVLTYSFDLW